MEDNIKELQVVEINVHDVEEGKNSDSASIEEISEETFIATHPLKSAVNRSTSSVKDSNSSNAGAGGSRVWPMRDIYKYQIASRSTYTGLYNLAWAQAVNNKPLGEVLVMMNDSGKDKNGSDMNISDADDDKVIVVEDDDEKEDGELEEGEIDLESELVSGPEDLNTRQIINEIGGDAADKDKKKRVDLIKKELENLSVVDGNTSYDSLCARLEKAADDLLEMAVQEDSFPEKESLVQLLLTAIRNSHSLYSSMTQRLKTEQNGNALMRLLAHVTSLRPPLFSTLQLKEMEMVMSFPNTLLADYRAKQPEDRFLAQTTKSDTINSRPKPLAVPLLDLHKDHDVDSLPSPTRELSKTLSFGTAFSSKHKPEWPVPAQTAGRESSPMYPSVTDAVRTASSYQQKFGRRNFSVNEKLPSPTPSEEGGETVNSDISGEVSSSISQTTAGVINSIPRKQAPSSASFKDTLTTEENRTQTFVRPPSTSENPAPRPSAKSRDPRLRLANFNAGKRNITPGGNECDSEPQGVVSMQKRNTVDEPVYDRLDAKRHRSDSTISGTGGWLEDNGRDDMLFTSVSTSRSAPNPIVHVQPSSFASTATVLPCFTATSTTPVTSSVNTSLTSQSTKQPAEDYNAASSLNLLRDMALAVNPSILMNFLKVEPAKSFESLKSANEMPISYSMVSSLPSTNAAPPSSAPGQIRTGIVETPLQEDSGKVRMKPRDPRRMLHKGALKNGPNAGTDQSKTVTSSSSTQVGASTTIRREEPLDEKLRSHRDTKLPDIAMPFTESLKNVADLVSVSQASTSLPIVPQNSLIQPSAGPQVVTGSKSNAAFEHEKMGNSIESASETSTRPAKTNAWSDFDHLLGGFNNEQKATIQLERAKRLEEQKKMFASRKLSLVLDLDHTLLNSAKFVEVDPQHDEILRKKEAQDREKAKREIFRFPHMGMWTKLRPGIWNFLEKASKLYELHLYTMGNKYYATEMAKLLDPSGELFSGRVISRGDDGETFDADDRVPKTKDLEGVMGMEPSVVIMDDSVRVWPNNMPNLIHVERYIYFPCSRRQFGLSGPSLLEIDHDERPEDGTLASSLAVIERIHANFFAHQSLDEADVRAILASEQRKILSGCRIVFSRIFPVGSANPHLTPLWIMAEQFGASCTSDLDEQVTHVVALSLGTDKVNWALSRGKFVVHPGWVEASSFLYRRANEHDFAIK